MAERCAFVCGHPVAHSRSPLIHGHWIAQHGIDGSYERIDVAPGDIRDFISSLAANGFAGGNVTIPHKEVAFEMVDRRDGEAEVIGAVNTLWFEGSTLCGGNTDAIGFGANLDAGAPEWRGRNRAVVLGAGGASRAIIHSILSAGYDRVDLVNRTVARAQDLAARFGSKVQARGFGELDAVLAGADLLVNTTSLGMDGAGELPADVSSLGDHCIVTDIVYVPLVTPLLAAAAARGLRTVDGLGMLLHQAVPGFEHWFGVRPTVTDELRALVIADMERH
ncbi:MAG: shikimate dehydrogenase [Mesorhizobium sp.]